MTETAVNGSLIELILSALDNPASPPHQALNERLAAATDKDTILGELSPPARWLHNLSFELTEQAERAAKEWQKASSYSAAESAAKKKLDQLMHRLRVIHELKTGLIGKQFFGHSNLVLLKDWKIAIARQNDDSEMDGVMMVGGEQLLQMLTAMLRRNN